MKKYIKNYLRHKKERGYRPRTIDEIRRSILFFYHFLKMKKIAKINREAFQKYEKYLKDKKKYVYSTITGKIGAIRWYFRYLTDNQEYLFNPADVLEYPQKSVRLMGDIPSVNEIGQILDSINTANMVGKRRKAILELFYSTGIRANELLNLDIYDVDLKRKTIFIRAGKGNKDRMVPFGQKAEIALKDYIENVRKYLAKLRNEKKLFLSMWGTRLKYKELLLVMPRRKNGKRLKAHSLRHACAIGMLRNGADIRYIQELLGHSSITTTQIYTRILPTHIQEVHAKYHPRAIKKRALAHMCGRSKF